MNMIRYQPWGLVHRLHHDLDRMLDRQWRDEDETTSPVSDWLPAVDIEEEDRQFVLRADIPGVDPKDIEIIHGQGCPDLTRCTPGRWGNPRPGIPARRTRQRWIFPPL